MHNRLSALALAAGSLLFCVSTLTGSAAAAPFWQPQSSSTQKSDCKDASGKTKSSKDCDKIGDRMSTKATSTNSAAASNSSVKGSKTVNAGHASSQVVYQDAAAPTSKTATTAADTATAKAAATDEKKSSKKSSDAVTTERMSTRGLKPAAKDSTKDKTTTTDAKPSPDTANPK
jgi:hypothetical protein